MRTAFLRAYVLVYTTGLVLIFLSGTSVFAETIRYEKGDHRDPFISLVGADGIVARKFDASDINVEGIIYDPHGESMVLINGEFYKQGDNVKGANVITIFRDRVILGRSDEEKTIWIREEVVNQGGKSPARPAAVKPKTLPKSTKKA